MDRDQVQDVETKANYFVCTLGQATTLNSRRPHPFHTVNDFIDRQNERIPHLTAVGFPQAKHGWSSRVFCEYLWWERSHRDDVILAALPAAPGVDCFCLF